MKAPSVSPPSVRSSLADSSQPTARSSHGLPSAPSEPGPFPANWPVVDSLRLMLTLIAALALPAGAMAESIEGHAIMVLDGDTFEFRDRACTITRVRLSQIDAPEKHQAFNQASKQSLTELVQGKTVRVEISGTGRQGGWIGTVWLGDVDINLEQVKRGMAWASAKPSTDSRYFDAEKDARLARRGIWSEDGAVPPWEYRNLEIRWRE